MIKSFSICSFVSSDASHLSTAYSLKPNFSIWDNAGIQRNKAFGESDSDVFEREFEVAKQTEDFNEDWEQALYRICYGRPRLKPRVADISKFFSYIKDELLADQQEEIGTLIADILTQTSVTSVTSTDQGQVVLPERGAYKRRYLEGIDAFILDGTENKKANEEENYEVLLRFEGAFTDAEFKFAGGMSLYWRNTNSLAGFSQKGSKMVRRFSFSALKMIIACPNYLTPAPMREKVH